MSTALSVESIQQAALDLQPSARAQLTHALVQSLAALPESEMSQIWLEEAERRDAEIESGAVSAIKGQEVFRRIHARYGK